MGRVPRDGFVVSWFMTHENSGTPGGLDETRVWANSARGDVHRARARSRPTPGARRRGREREDATTRDNFPRTRARARERRRDAIDESRASIAIARDGGPARAMEFECVRGVARARVDAAKGGGERGRG